MSETLLKQTRAALGLCANFRCKDKCAPGSVVCQAHKCRNPNCIQALPNNYAAFCDDCELPKCKLCDEPCQNHLSVEGYCNTHRLQSCRGEKHTCEAQQHAPACPKHKCKECESVAAYPDGCCSDHSKIKCLVCSKIAVVDSKFCEDHKCMKCNNGRREKGYVGHSYLCEDHICQFHHCNQAASPGATACEYHRCHTLRCTKPYDNYGTCPEHKCKRNYYPHKCEGPCENGLCQKHATLCTHFGICLELRKASSTYCVKHGCVDEKCEKDAHCATHNCPKCNGRKLADVPYCSECKCKACTEDPHLEFSPYCQACFDQRGTHCLNSACDKEMKRDDTAFCGTCTVPKCRLCPQPCVNLRKPLCMSVYCKDHQLQICGLEYCNAIGHYEFCEKHRCTHSGCFKQSGYALSDKCCDEHTKFKCKYCRKIIYELRDLDEGVCFNDKCMALWRAEVEISQAKALETQAKTSAWEVVARKKKGGKKKANQERLPLPST